jgi:hypothetical protein
MNHSTTIIRTATHVAADAFGRMSGLWMAGSSGQHPKH